MFYIVFEKGIPKFFAVIICSIIVNRVTEYGGYLAYSDQWARNIFFLYSLFYVNIQCSSGNLLYSSTKNMFTH